MKIQINYRSRKNNNLKGSIRNTSQPRYRNNAQHSNRQNQIYRSSTAKHQRRPKQKKSISETIPDSSIKKQEDIFNHHKAPYFSGLQSNLPLHTYDEDQFHHQQNLDLAFCTQ